MKVELLKIYLDSNEVVTINSFYPTKVIRSLYILFTEESTMMWMTLLSSAASGFEAVGNNLP